MSTVILTHERLNARKGNRGEFCSDVVNLLGENMRLKGWPSRLLNKRVSLHDYEQAVFRSKLPKIKGVRFGESEGQDVMKLF